MFKVAQFIYDHDVISIRSLIIIMSKHADVCARGVRAAWSLEWHEDRIVINFTRNDDAQFFETTFKAACGRDLESRRLVPPSPAPTRSGGNGGVLSQLRASRAG